jgi:hypothetical protein
LETNGYIDLSNIRLDTGSFIANYMYWFIVVFLLVVFHGVIIIVTNLKFIKEKDEESKIKKTLMAIRRTYEFGVYFYIIMATSLFIWLCVVNEIAACRFDTILNICSYCISFIVLILLFALMMFPVLMLALEFRANRKGTATQDGEIDEEEKTVIDKIWTHYRYGLRKTVPSQLFYTTTQFKYF